MRHIASFLHLCRNGFLGCERSSSRRRTGIVTLRQLAERTVLFSLDYCQEEGFLPKEGEARDFSASTSIFLEEDNRWQQLLPGAANPNFLFILSQLFSELCLKRWRQGGKQQEDRSFPQGPEDTYLPKHS